MMQESFPVLVGSVLEPSTIACYAIPIIVVSLVLLRREDVPLLRRLGQHFAHFLKDRKRPLEPTHRDESISTPIVPILLVLMKRVQRRIDRITHSWFADAMGMFSITLFLALGGAGIAALNQHFDWTLLFYVLCSFALGLVCMIALRMS